MSSWTPERMFAGHWDKGAVFTKNWFFSPKMNVFLQHSPKRIFFWMSIDFFQRLTTLKGTYIHQMSCTRDDFSTKISLKEHFWQDLIGVWKITLLSKDPVGTGYNKWIYSAEFLNMTKIWISFKRRRNYFQKKIGIGRIKAKVQNIKEIVLPWLKKDLKSLLLRSFITLGLH